MKLLIIAAVALAALAAAACDLEVPAMPMVGEEAGGNAGGPAPEMDEGAPPPEPPGIGARIGMTLVSFVPVGLLVVAGVALAIYLNKSRGRKTE